MNISAQAAQPTELVTPWLPQLVSLGGFGLLLLALGYSVRAIVTGKIITLARFMEMKQDRDDYKQLYKEERELRVEAQKTASVAMESAAVANENSKVANHFLEALEQNAATIIRGNQP